MTTREAASPLMQQYREIKARHQDAILLVRMGDFYEMFYEDAEVASRVLGLTLTARHNGGVAGAATDGGENSFGNHHAFDVVRVGFRANENDRALAGHFHRAIGGEGDAAGGGARAGIDALREKTSAFHGDAFLFLVKDRSEELSDLVGFDTQNGFFFGDEFFFHHVDSGANRGDEFFVGGTEERHHGDDGEQAEHAQGATKREGGEVFHGEIRDGGQETGDRRQETGDR